MARRQLSEFGEGEGDLPDDYEYKVKTDVDIDNPRLRRAYIALKAWKDAMHSDPLNFTANWVGPDVCSYNGVFCTAALDSPSTQVVAGAFLFLYIYIKMKT